MALRNRFGRQLYPRGTQPEGLPDAQPSPRNPTEGLCQAAQGFGLFRKTLTENGRPSQFEGSLTLRRLRRARPARAEATRPTPVPPPAAFLRAPSPHLAARA